MRRENGSRREMPDTGPEEAMKCGLMYARLHKETEMQVNARILNSLLTSGDLVMMKMREKHVSIVASGERT
jgi:hypothetical protein